MPDEILANIAQAEAIEATRLAIEFLLTHSEPCVGDMDRLKRVNMAAFEIVTELLESDKEAEKV